MKIVGAIEGLFALVALVVVAFIGWKAWGYFKSKGVLGAAQDLKQNTPLGIPARAIDAGISKATGRDETLGGWFADLVNPQARAANRMLSTMPTPPSLPSRDVKPVDSPGIFVGDLPMGEIALPNPRNAR